MRSDENRRRAQAEAAHSRSNEQTPRSELPATLQRVIPLGRALHFSPAKRHDFSPPFTPVALSLKQSQLTTAVNSVVVALQDAARVLSGEETIALAAILAEIKRDQKDELLEGVVQSISAVDGSVKIDRKQKDKNKRKTKGDAAHFLVPLPSLLCFLGRPLDRRVCLSCRRAADCVNHFALP